MSDEYEYLRNHLDLLNSKKSISDALNIAFQYSQIDGAHHKAWVLDQMVRALCGCYDQYPNATYKDFIAAHNKGSHGPDTYEWDVGIAP